MLMGGRKMGSGRDVGAQLVDHAQRLVSQLLGLKRLMAVGYPLHHRQVSITAAPRRLARALHGRLVHANEVGDNIFVLFSLHMCPHIIGCSAKFSPSFITIHYRRSYVNRSERASTIPA